MFILDSKIMLTLLRTNMQAHESMMESFVNKSEDLISYFAIHFFVRCKLRLKKLMNSK